MRISGHKTASVFETYDITSDDDLREASKKIVQYHKEQEKNMDPPPEHEPPDGEGDGE